MLEENDTSKLPTYRGPLGIEGSGIHRKTIPTALFPQFLHKIKKSTGKAGHPLDIPTRRPSTALSHRNPSVNLPAGNHESASIHPASIQMRQMCHDCDCTLSV